MIAGAPATTPTAARPPHDSPAPARERLLYLDNLRTFLTGLVICHHSAVALGASGGWYYVLPPPPGSAAPAALTLFTAVNQAFFMSLFFAISGYVTPASYDAKGPWPFLRDRLARLGIPLVVYFFVLNPLLVFLVARLQGSVDGPLAFVGQDYPSTVGTGPLWFVLALLVFGSIYAGLRVASGRERERTGTRPFPDTLTILGFVLAIGGLAFVVRLVFPTGWSILGLQLGYFPLYVAFFVFGVWAHGNGWLARLDRAQVRFWGRAARIASLAFLVAVFLGGGPDAVNGGWNLPALAYAMWEPWLCVAISLWLLVLFRERFATQGGLARRMARSAYTAYIIHPFPVVCGTALVARIPVDPLLRFPVLCVLAVSSTFALSDVIRRVPRLARIL